MLRRLRRSQKSALGLMLQRSCRFYCDDPSFIPQYDKLVQRFKDSHIPDPESSAKWIALSAQSDPSLLETLVQCRLSRMPLQYIIKEWPFRGLNLQMRPPVFIPRPETEKIIDLAIAFNPKSVLEIGCGSGAIAIGLLSECPSIQRCVAVDRSKMAVDLTKDNAKRLLGNQNQSKLEVLCNPINSGGTFEYPIEGPFDLVISNPPYILRKDLHNVEPEIGLYEDLRALDGGPDGLDVIKSIFSWISQEGVLNSDSSRLILEVDPCHPSIVIPKYLEDSPGIPISIESIHTDYLERERFVIIKKKFI
ncbi:hemK [Lepeophtheirus salmonis]|uniref:peptide chain release factor N(5)-glutamine methyltransferase n=1 Tax=Lepeophtheirus salmonis TaxID=72036 RepID=A0A7R8CF00_LEPSM|nr:MTRF1L release factor glutamine methyltransferase-like [Lepeophtheirus salmonis]CAB4056560.1 hemK [Lepeophtheirus salmonis]CAF2801104.1 hemK [Lepeophtheirus salmonis]